MQKKGEELKKKKLQSFFLSFCSCVFFLFVFVGLVRVCFVRCSVWGFCVSFLWEYELISISI